ncbi:unnamed protein product [Thelazia callipaeda]|uniref:Microtubule-associated protein Jupiter n=1 Tax=Thelazia callipaeda TaxID=103827 RepID=A0A0N5CQ67_THECL|nr:unnamed protein product [Thelazia callipaeda]
MLFTCSGSSNVRNRRIVIIGQERILPRRCSVVSDRSELPLSSANSQDSAFCLETFRTDVSSPIKDSNCFQNRSNSRISSRTEILRPGQWTTVTPHVKFRALTLVEQQEVFRAQKHEEFFQRPKSATVIKMDEGADGSNAKQNTEIISRVPDSPGSRSNYGEFYW